MKTSLRSLPSLALSVFLVVNLTLPAGAAQFIDTSGHWAQQAIDSLSQKRVLSGYPTGEFRPEGRITRAEFATAVVRALGLESQYVDNGTNNFVDVSPSFWGYRNIEIVSDKGIISGYPGGYFRPNQDISRVEAMAVLVNAAGVPLPSQTDAAQILRNYSDAYLVPQWAQRGVAAAIQSGIFVNYPSANLIEPSQPATRAEVAVMTDRLQTYSASRTMPGGAATAGSTVMMPPASGGTTTTGSMTQQGELLRGHVSVVPAGSVFTGVVTQNISSEQNHVGDPVAITLDRPLLSAAGDIVVPQGSQVLGSITAIDPAGRGEKNAGIEMDFNRVVTPDGRTFNLSAEVNAEGGVLKGGTTKGRVGRIAGRTLGGAAIGGAAGAIIGRAAGGKGRADEGLLWGSLLGSGIGAASAVTSAGKEVMIQPGDGLELRLRQPLTVTSP